MSLLAQKLRAFSIHFLISLFVIGGFFLYTVFIMYTPKIMEFEGGQYIAILLLSVDLTLGPIMTTILYRKGKKGLKLDLIVVAVLQLSAFLYGAHILYSQRPVYLAYVIDNIKIMPASVVDPSAAPDESLHTTLFSGPRLVFVELPTDERAGDIALSVLTQGAPDVEAYPEFYRPFHEHEKQIRERIYNIDNLPLNNKAAAIAIEELLSGSGLAVEDVYIAPIKGHATQGAAIFKRTDLSLLGYIDTHVW